MTGTNLDSSVSRVRASDHTLTTVTRRNPRRVVRQSHPLPYDYGMPRRSSPQTKQPSKKLSILEAVPATSDDHLIVRYPFQTDLDFAYAYHEAAKRLASTFEGKAQDDAILMPFLMLYRQAFELELKSLVRYLASLRRKWLEPNNPDLVPKAVDERLKNKHGHRLAAIRDELLDHWKALDLPEAFPKGVSKVIEMLHADDPSGTALRYAGETPVEQQNADFPALAARLDEELSMLGASYDFVDGIYSAAPEPEDWY
jgi:hypothetical protein